MRNKPVLFVFVLLPLLGGIATVVLSMNTTFSFEHPQGETMIVTRAGRVKRRETPVDPNTKQPKVVPSETSHDFGTMDPLTMGQHVFMLRNEGTAPLRIRRGPTTCKCTLSKVARNEILPGEEVAVTLDWNTGRDRFYSHEATIYTNDPDLPNIELHVHGKVRELLGMIPETVNFANLRPDQPETAEIIVFSQIWSEFQLTDGQSSHDGITWTVEPFDAGTLEDATSALRVKITVPAHLPSGDLAERVQFSVQPTDGEPTTLSLPISGRVPRRLAVYGPGVRTNGTIDLGHLAAGEGLERRLLLKVRDEEKDLIATSIQCKPDFVSASIVPYEGNTQSAGLLQLIVTIPQDAPVCSYLGVPLGELRIDFEHPRIETLEMKLKFAVVQ